MYRKRRGMQGAGARLLVMLLVTALAFTMFIQIPSAVSAVELSALETASAQTDARETFELSLAEENCDVPASVVQLGTDAAISSMPAMVEGFQAPGAAATPSAIDVTRGGITIQQEALNPGSAIDIPTMGTLAASIRINPLTALIGDYAAYSGAVEIISDLPFQINFDYVSFSGGGQHYMSVVNSPEQDGSYKYVLSDDGTYRNIVAVDSANTQFKFENITIDKEKPTLKVLRGEKADASNSNSPDNVTLEADIADHHVYKLQYSLDGIDWFDFEYGWDAATNAIADNNADIYANVFAWYGTKYNSEYYSEIYGLIHHHLYPMFYDEVIADGKSDADASSYAGTQADRWADQYAWNGTEDEDGGTPYNIKKQYNSLYSELYDLYYDYCFPWYYYGQYDSEDEHLYNGSAPINPSVDKLYYRAVNLRSGRVSDVQTYSGGVSAKGTDAYYLADSASETHDVTIDITVDTSINPVVDASVEYAIPDGFSLTKINGADLQSPIVGDGSWVDLGELVTLDGSPITLTIVAEGTAAVGGYPYSVAFSKNGTSIGGGGGVLYAYNSTYVNVTYHSNNGNNSTWIAIEGHRADHRVLGISVWQYVGYEFDGWNTQADGSGIDYAPDDVLSITIYDIDLYAKWVPLYGIIYDANGGSTAPTDSERYRSGALVTISSTPVTRFDHTFIGWLYDGRYYFAGETVAMVSGSITMKAQWQRDAYSVVYAPGTQGTWSASGETYTSLHYNDSLPVFGTKTGASTAFSHAPGYRFNGWAATPPAKIPSIPGGDTLTYVAQWRENAYTITYVSNNGSAAVTGNVLWGSNVLLPAAPTRTGYTFNGWRLTDNGTGTGSGATIVGGETFKVLAANDDVGGITISADWTAITGATTTTGNRTTPSSTASSRTSDASSAPDSSLEPDTLERADSSLDSADSDVSDASDAPKTSRTPSDSATGIEDADTPLAASGSHWALMNLILAVLGGVITLITLIMGRPRRSGINVGADGSGQGSKRGIWRVLSILAVVIAIVIFVLTQSLTGSMVIVDWMTIVYAVIVIAQVAFFALVSLRKNVMGGGMPQA